MTFLRQASPINIKVGPFIDQTDGVTPLTSLTITQPDVQLSSNGGAFAQKSAAQTLAHDVDGWYTVGLSTTDTGALGSLKMEIDVASSIPVWLEFDVITAEAWDSLFSGTGVGLRADVRGWLGATPTTPSTAGVPNVDVARAANVAWGSGAITPGSIAANAITSAKIATDALGSAQVAAGAVTKIQSGLATAAALSTAQGDITTIDTVVDAIKVITDALGVTGATRLALSAGQIIPFTVDTVVNGHTPTVTEFQADNIAEATPDHYNGRIIIFTSGALAGQGATITDYAAVGGIGQFTVGAMTEAPANNDTGIIL